MGYAPIILSGWIFYISPGRFRIVASLWEAKVEFSGSGAKGEMIMKYLLATMLLLLPTLAHTDETFRDKYGDYAGGSSRNGDTRDFRNRYGSYAGSESNDGNGQFTIRDKNGDVTGSIDED